MKAISFTQWQGYLRGLSLMLMLQGLSWTLMGGFDPWGIYEGYAAESFWGASAFSPDVQRFAAFIMVPFGATDAAYFLLVFFVAGAPFGKHEPWSWRALIFSFSLWFLWDTGLSIWQQAWFNIWIVNLPCLLLFMPPLLATRKYFAAKGDAIP